MFKKGNSGLGNNYHYITEDQGVIVDLSAHTQFKMVQNIFKKKGRERHLPDSYLMTSLGQKEHNENGWNRSFQPTMWLSSAVEVDSRELCRSL